MSAPTFTTVRDGDDIVIRIPLAALAAALSTTRDLGGPVGIVDGDALLDELVVQMNACNAVEAMVIGEVGQALDEGSETVRLLPQPARPGPDPHTHPRYVMENMRDVALAQLRAEGMDLPSPNIKH